MSQLTKNVHYHELFQSVEMMSHLFSHEVTDTGRIRLI